MTRLSTEINSASATFGVFDRPDFSDDTPHEQVTFCTDPSTGLKAIIAIHSTTLGPALGGTRFYPYPDEQAALTDALRLSRGMTYKAAVAGLDLGGGKAVIIGDPAQLKTPELLRAYGSFVETLNGRYITAGDIGTTSEDMDLIGERTEHVVARTAAQGGSGDSAPLTALGVFRSMEAAAAHVWGSPELQGRVIGVEGVGKVGRKLAALLTDAGATVLLSDVNRQALAMTMKELPTARVSPSLMAADLDVYAPCALGGALTFESVDALSARVVCGAANNQLANPSVEQRIYDKDSVWVPDFVANSGGLVQVAGEINRESNHDVLVKVDAIGDTVAQILQRQRESGLRAGEVARDIALDRLAANATGHTAS
jgi:valine dehydrogenase (NAD+)